jgi:pyruvate dehydrogenase E2 component (dihydrolipoamide acetyltransferase)
MPQVNIVMPKMSMTMTEGELLAWHCKVGDVISEGDVVCEVATDKIDMEVEATASGTVLELRGEIGDVMEVGTPLIIVDSKTDDLLAGIFDAPAAPAASVAAPVTEATPEIAVATSASASSTDSAVAPVANAATVETQPVRVNDTVLATPKARAVAAENDVDLHYVAGTGTDGVIKHDDVLAAKSSTPNPDRTIANRLKARGAIAKALANSSDIPTFSMTFETSNSSNFATSGGDRLTHLVKAWANTLHAFPELHANWNDGNLVSFNEVKVAISVMATTGVVTPVVAVPTSIDGNFTNSLKAIVANAATGKIALEHLAVSTTGFFDFGSSSLVATNGLLIRPQSLAVAFSSPSDSVLRFTIAADHRISDPADVALIAERLVLELKK